jgi:HEAT repeat protein
MALGMMGDSANIHGLSRRALRSVERKAEVRAGAILGLGSIADERSAAILFTILHGNDERENKALALSALVQTGVRSLPGRGGRQARKVALTRFLERKVGNRNMAKGVRQSAALGLGACGDKGSIPVLQRVSRVDPDDKVRALAYIALGELAGRLPDAKPVGAFLARAVRREKSGAVKAYLFLAMGISRDPDAGPVLRKAFLKENMDGRGAAAVALGLIRDGGAARLLGEELTRPRSGADVRWYCCQGLGLMGGPEASQLLRWALESTHTPYIRAAACKGLAILGDRSAVPLLIEHLDSKNRMIQTWAVQGLGDFRDSRAIPGLMKVVGSGCPAETRALAVVSLGKIGEEWKEIPPLRRIVDRCNWLAAMKYPTVSLVLRLL